MKYVPYNHEIVHHLNLRALPKCLITPKAAMESKITNISIIRVVFTGTQKYNASVVLLSFIKNMYKNIHIVATE